MDAAPDRLVLASRTAFVEIHALAPDLFRIVASTRDAGTGPAGTGARPVVNPHATHARVRQRGRRVTLETAAASFRIHPASGAWEVLDRHGLEVFAAPPEAVTFHRPGSRLTLVLAEREALFGLGDSTGTLDKRGLIRTVGKHENPAAATPADSLPDPGPPSSPTAIPFALSLRDGRAAGLFWDSPGPQAWDLGATDRALWRMTDTLGRLDLHLFTGPRPADVLARFTERTGRMPLPPRWALGHVPWRQDAVSASDVEAVTRAFRRRRLPCEPLHPAIQTAGGLPEARARYEDAVHGRHGSPILRPLVITAGGSAGIQRHAAISIDDNASTWEHFDASVRRLLSLGLSGVPFAGAAVGGSREPCTPELYVRWLQAAVFTPFLPHPPDPAAGRREPWAFGRAIEAITRPSLELRYQILPWLYCLFAEAARSGAPVMRPLLWHHPNDPIAVACSDQFLLGEHLLVAPILRPGAVARSVYLPRGEWFDFHSGTPFPGGVHAVVHAPLDQIPVFVRSGALLPLAPTRPCVGPREPDTPVLHVWPGTDGRLDWYDDDGLTLGHASGAWLRRTLTAASGPAGGRLVIGPAEGRHPGQTRRWRIIVREVPRARKVRVAGRPVPAQYIPELRILAFDVPAVPKGIEARWR